MGKGKENNSPQKTGHTSLCPKGNKTHCSAASRKRLRGSVICRSSGGALRLGFAVDQWAVSFVGGVLRVKGSEVALLRMQGEGRLGGRIGGQGLGAGGRTLEPCSRGWGMDMDWGKAEDRRQNVSESVSMCARCVCPNLFICCTGGLSHCLEVLSCVPLGPTRRLVTHLKVSFSVVQHHLKDQCSACQGKQERSNSQGQNKHPKKTL